MNLQIKSWHKPLTSAAPAAILNHAERIKHVTAVSQALRYPSVGRRVKGDNSSRPTLFPPLLVAARTGENCNVR